MKKLLLLVLSITMFTSCDPANLEPTPDMDGRWVVEGDNPNTMYIYANGVRYTYYCAYDDCKEYFREECEAGDANAIPGTNNYTFENGTLTVDLGGTNLVTTIIFECDGEIATFETPGYSLYKLGTDCQ
jgi:hypothetical protein|tara:strand:- start:262 stop:648 length:387 start_codon:yes stop_codon:yes gene_type:complete